MSSNVQVKTYYLDFQNRAVLESLSLNNKQLLDLLESSIAIVVLEDCAAGGEVAGMRHSLGGNLCNRWVDKSLSLNFFTDGVVSSLCDVRKTSNNKNTNWANFNCIARCLRWHGEHFRLPLYSHWNERDAGRLAR